MVGIQNTHNTADPLGAYERDMTDEGGFGQSLGIFRIAAHKLCMTINRRVPGNLERDRPGRVQGHIA